MKAPNGEAMLQEIARLKAELNQVKSDGMSNNNAATILSGFISKGAII